MRSGITVQALVSAFYDSVEFAGQDIQKEVHGCTAENLARQLAALGDVNNLDASPADCIYTANFIRDSVEPPCAKCLSDAKEVRFKDSQINSFVKELHHDIGGVWVYMVPSVRRAFVEAKVLNVIRLQDRKEISIASIDELTVKMLNKTGL